MTVEVPQPLPGWWDHSAVEQIVGNLLSNALKFGQGRPIRVEVRGDAAGVSISVCDRGVGVALADRAAHLRALHPRAGATRRGARPGPLAGARAGGGPRRPRDGAQPQGSRVDVHRLAALAATGRPRRSPLPGPAGAAAAPRGPFPTPPRRRVAFRFARVSGRSPRPRDRPRRSSPSRSRPPSGRPRCASVRSVLVLARCAVCVRGSACSSR